jgi:phospholipase C
LRRRCALAWSKKADYFRKIDHGHAITRPLPPAWRPVSLPPVGHEGIRQPVVTRRTLLRGVAGGAALAAAGGLPAWARPVAGARGHRRRPDSLPFPHLPAGTESMHQIKHVVVLMMENHSFDNLLGMVPHQVPGRGNVDGLTIRRNGRPADFNPGPHGRVYARHSVTPCQDPHLPNQTWNASHQSYDRGFMEGFVAASGNTAMLYWDGSDIPFTYSLARHFPIGQRYFCSVLAQTYPNRRFFFCATASGLIATDSTTFSTPAQNGTIWDRLDPHGISYAVYYQNLPSWAIVPGAITGRGAKQHKMDDFYPDVAAGKLPAFTFIDPNYDTTSQENPQDIQVGERFIARVVNALMAAPTWQHTALFITYDEHGGYYDHVPPPRAVEPDDIAPMLGPRNVGGAYNRYGFRVPMIVVSPWAKKGYLSNVVQDHTSMCAFIERKWNLPAMTFRDANADAMTGYFDFSRAAFATPPRLASAPPLQPGVTACKAHGFNPPLPSSKYDGAGDYPTR